MKKSIRIFVERTHWLKAVPNALTLCNSLCGFAAIINTLRVYERMYIREGATDASEILAQSAILIFSAMIFDALDGFAARLLNAASMHGIQMDSLADMVTFGVAPATLIVVMTHSLPNFNEDNFYLVWALAAIYLGGAALRLATYNVHAMVEKKSSEKFSGLPSPGAAAGICTAVIYYNSLGMEIHHLAVVLPIYGALLGILMVSRIQYIHFAKWILSLKRNRKRLLLVAVVLIAACFELELTAFAAVNGYILLGVLCALGRKIGLLRTAAEERRAA